MVDIFRPARPGDAIRGIPSELYNLTIENDKDYIRRRGQKAGDVSGPGLLKIGIRNGLGFSLPQYSIVGIGANLVVPDSAEAFFFGRLTFEAATPNSTQTFAILQEPAQTDALVTAILHGPSLCFLDVTDATHQYAGPVLGSTGGLTTLSRGPARVVWKLSGSVGKTWALVVIDDSSTTIATTPPPKDQIFPVYISDRALQSGVWAYTGTEQTPGATIGAYSTLSGGRTFDKTAGPWLVELNNHRVDIPQYVWARYKTRVSSVDVYEFSECCEETVTVGSTPGTTYQYKFHSIDALLSGATYKIHTIDALLQKRNRKYHRINALIARRRTRAHRIDALLTSSGGGGSPGSQTFTSDGTFTATYTGTHTFRAYGAGQGGTDTIGSGGAGGHFAEATYSLTINDVVTITVAAGGVHQMMPGVPGDTSAVFGVTTIVLARGGGSLSSDTGTTTRVGGTGGSASISAGGGGGGCAGTTTTGGNGGNASGGTGGTGGTAGGGSAGAGGAGGDTGAAGAAGNSVGGGGGGGGTGSNGGDGYRGQVEITW